MTDILLGLALAVATRYEEPYVGRPLYCGGYYEIDAAPWFAVPVSQIDEIGCNTLIHAHGVTDDGEPWSMMGRVRDVGPFDDSCVMQPDGTCAPILFDIGGVSPWGDDLSARLEGWTNITREARRHGVN